MIRKCIAVFADILAVLAFGLALFIACRVFPSNDNTTFDYQAILVAILAGLFTLIVGWNIYQTIDLNRRILEIDSLRVELGRQLEKQKEKTDRQLEKIKNDIECDQAKILGMLSQSATATFVSNEKIFLKYKMISHGIDAIRIFSTHPENNDSEESIAKIMNTIINGLNNSKEIQFDKTHTQNLVLKCGQIQNHRNIKNFKDFVTLIQETAEE